MNCPQYPPAARLSKLDDGIADK